MNLLKTVKILRDIGPAMLFLMSRAAWSTMQLEVFGSQNMARAYQKHGQIICAFWHNRTILLPLIYRYEMRLTRLVAMVSRSRDGQFLADFLHRFGFESIRASTSTAGTGTIVQVARIARQGYDIAIAPDGPRGPRYQVQPGIIKLAQMTSLPIVPVSYQASIRKELHSWDRFIIPAPFAKIAFEIAPAITVPRRSGQKGLERARLDLQERLIQLDLATSLRLGQRGKPGEILAQCTGSRSV